jgi:hypothetical protein
VKNKFAIINFCLSTVVLVSILFQSVHSYEHIYEQLTSEKCDHEQHLTEEITHDHHGFDHCFACEFTFSNFTKTEFFSFTFLKNQNIFKPEFAISPSKTTFFCGSLFFLRGPPLA